MFSLILATVGRLKEVDCLLESLGNQTVRDFELLVIDQNQDGLIDGIIDKYKDEYRIIHVKTVERGLSKARNIGLKHASGNVVCFPDDDCYYEKNTLEEVNDIFKNDKNIGGIIGQTQTEDNIPLLEHKMCNYAILNKDNLWSCALSTSIFIRKEVVDKVGFFDERLGVGASTIFGSGEETDYLYRALNSGCVIKFFRDVRIYHPRKDDVLNLETIKRAYNYGCGCGFVLKKNNASAFMKFKFILRPFLGAVLAFFTFNKMLAMKRWNTLCGRVNGMMCQ